jgi:hypothetical protein
MRGSALVFLLFFAACSVSEVFAQQKLTLEKTAGSGNEGVSTTFCLKTLNGIQHSCGTRTYDTSLGGTAISKQANNFDSVPKCFTFNIPNDNIADGGKDIDIFPQFSTVFTCLSLDFVKLTFASADNDDFFRLRTGFGSPENVNVAEGAAPVSVTVGKLGGNPVKGPVTLKQTSGFTQVTIPQITSVAMALFAFSFCFVFFFFFTALPCFKKICAHLVVSVVHRGIISTGILFAYALFN